MTDVFNKAKRSDIMRRVRSANTAPELRLRKRLHAFGFRYKLHDAKLPGKPDLVFPKWKAVIHVRGCFWHSHVCRGGRIPKGHRDYWEPKLARNRHRDEQVDAALAKLGWRVFVIWECQIKSMRSLGRIADRLHVCLKVVEESL